VIQIKDLSFQYSSSSLYDNFNLLITEPGIHGLFGTNGTGKSTLLKLVNGLLFPISGSCAIYGQLSMTRNPDLLERIYYLPEEIDSPAITAVQLGQLKGAFYPRFDVARLNELLSIFGIPEGQLISKMSYGQKKKTYIAAALSTGAPILLMDEPTNGLDIPSKSHFRQAIEQFKLDDQIILISTHQVRDLDHILQHLLILQEGKILLQKSIEQIQNELLFTSNVEELHPADIIYTKKVGDQHSYIAKNKSGKSQNAHLETLITAIFEQPNLLNH
jgi:ABC-2 type transport system ATP-binding protein